MLNEYEEIVAQFFVSSTSYEQIRQNIEDFIQSKKSFGHSAIQCLFIDSCCTDRDFYEHSIPDLMLNLKRPPDATIDSTEYIYISTRDTLQLAVHVDHFYSLCCFDNLNSALPIGLDCEWGRDVDGTGMRHNVGMIQMSIPNGIIFTHLRKDFSLSYSMYGECY